MVTKIKLSLLGQGNAVGTSYRSAKPGVTRELANSIFGIGLMHPLMVSPRDNGRYRVVHGALRFEALKMLVREKKISRQCEVDCEVRRMSIEEIAAFRRANDLSKQSFANAQATAMTNYQKALVEEATRRRTTMLVPSALGKMAAISTPMGTDPIEAYFDMENNALAVWNTGGVTTGRAQAENRSFRVGVRHDPEWEAYEKTFCNWYAANVRRFDLGDQW